MDNYSHITYRNTFDSAVNEIIKEVLTYRNEFKSISLNFMKQMTEDMLHNMDSTSFLNLSLIGWIHFKKDTAKRISDSIMKQILTQISSTPSEFV